MSRWELIYYANTARGVAFTHQNEIGDGQTDNHRGQFSMFCPLMHPINLIADKYLLLASSIRHAASLGLCAASSEQIVFAALFLRACLLFLSFKIIIKKGFWLWRRRDAIELFAGGYFHSLYILGNYTAMHNVVIEDCLLHAFHVNDIQVPSRSWWSIFPLGNLPVDHIQSYI